MRITKTDYLNYLTCPEFAWLEKHKPYAVDTEPSGYEQKLIRDGYEVEKYAQEIFPDGQMSDHVFTKEHKPEKSCLFQPTFVTDDGLEARTDILQNEESAFNIYEVKSSTSIKERAGRDHIRDVAFQKIVLERCGLTVARVNIIHLDSDYIREDGLDLEGIFKIEDVTDRVDDIKNRVADEIEDLKNLMQKDAIDEGSCSCRLKTRSNHCHAFTYFNGQKPATSIYNIPRISENKIRSLLNDGVEGMANVPAGFDLSEKQQIYVQAAKADTPQIDKNEIKQYLSEYTYPIHFLDYETYQPAVPKLKGTGPHSHTPFQASLHILSEDGDLQHFEYLNDELTHPKDLADFLQESVKENGSVVVWSDRFEKNRNKEMGEQFSAYKEFFMNLNERMVDQEDIFKTAYVHPDAAGSTSLKSVLPALPVNISYDDLSIQGGTMAMEQWEGMVTSDMSDQEKGKRREELLAYCKLDTLSMVKIYQFLRGEFNGQK